MKMKVAWLLPSGIAPAEAQSHIPALTSLAARMARRVDLTIFTFSDEQQTIERTFNGARVVSLPVPWNAPFLWRTWHLLRDVIRYHRNQAFDVFHGFWAMPCGFYATVLSRLLSSRSVVTFLGGETAAVRRPSYGNLLGWKSRAVTLWTARRTHRLHLLTEYQKNQLATYQRPAPHWAVSPLGIDPSLFRPGRMSMRKPIRLLHVANITEIKDQETLIDSIVRISQQLPLRLRIIGPDHRDGKLQQYVCERGVGHLVEFLGHIPHRSLPSHYRWAHFYLHTSLHEGEGMSVMEAMACGAVVCGTRVGIIADLPEDCRMALPIRDSAALADAIIHLVRNHRVYASVRTAALRWITAHTEDASAEQMTEFYTGLTP